LEALGTAVPSTLNKARTTGAENSNNDNGNKDDEEDELEGEQAGNVRDPSNIIAKYATRFVWIVIALSWWMLFMTAIWFHTWLEKLSGLLLSVTAIYLTYFLPRILPSWADIIGIPGYEPAVRLE